MNRIAFFFACPRSRPGRFRAGGGGGGVRQLRRTNPVQAISKWRVKSSPGQGWGARSTKWSRWRDAACGDQMPSTPQMTEMLDEVFEEMEEEMRLQRRAMLNRAARIMARRLTEEELSEIAAFFNSPAGERYVELQPLFLDDIFTAMDDWSEEMFEYLSVRVQAEISRRELQ